MNTRKSHVLVLLFGLLLSSAIFVVNVSPAQASPGETITSTWIDGEPTLDGKIDSGEWKNKKSITLRGFKQTGEKLDGTIYMMHDSGYLYCCIVIKDADTLIHKLFFDEGNDEYLTKDNEFSIYFEESSAKSSYWDGDSFQETSAAEQPIFSAAEHTGAQILEFKMPINAGEPSKYTLDLKSGDSIGFCLLYHEGWYAGAGNFIFPEEAATTDNPTARPDRWAKITLETAEDDNGEDDGDNTDDTTKPSVVIMSPASGATVDGTITIKADVTDTGSGIKNAEVSINGGTWHSMTYSSGDTYTYSWDTTSVEDGAHTINVKVTDNAGNSNTAQVTVEVKNGQIGGGMCLGTILIVVIPIAIYFSKRKNTLQ